jgi:pimeloyl-ACP methyl ester carboxylesterase
VFNQSFITTNHVKLHVVSDGPAGGPLVILLHGFPEHWRSWQHQIPVLAEAGYYAVAPDQRGYNLSDKPPHVRDYGLDLLTLDIAGLVEALGRKEAVIVAHDWGGVVGYRFAMDYPQLTRKLVVMNAPHPLAMARELKTFSQARKSWYIGYFQIPWLPETVFSLAPRYWARVFFRNVAVNKQAFSDEDLLSMAQANGQPGAMRSMINWYRAALRYPPKTPPKNITAPTLIIWAEDDVALGKPLTFGMQQWFSPDFRIEYIPRCGHWVQNEASAQVNGLLLEFLAGAAGE